MNISFWILFYIIILFIDDYIHELYDIKCSMITYVIGVDLTVNWTTNKSLINVTYNVWSDGWGGGYLKNNYSYNGQKN